MADKMLLMRQLLSKAQLSESSCSYPYSLTIYDFYGDGGWLVNDDTVPVGASVGICERVSQRLTALLIV